MGASYRFVQAGPHWRHKDHGSGYRKACRVGKKRKHIELC